MRLMIQIPAFLEILISCFLRSNQVEFSRWASRPGEAPRNRSPSGWRTKGKLAGLVESMPDVSPTWSPGRTDFATQRAEHNARDFGPDEEMLQALVRDCWVPSSKLPNLETR